MQVFRGDDMTCGHCASSITKAVRAVDAGATVEVNLGQHLVRIAPTEADAAELAEAITEAGYTPVPVESQAGTPQPAGRRSGCCGCCG
jgi:copper chaperone